MALVAGANVAAWIGLCAAVREHVQAGPSRIWDRLAVVGRQTREALADLPGWAVVGPADAGSAITALRATGGQDIADTGPACSTSTASSPPRPPSSARPAR